MILINIQDWIRSVSRVTAALVSVS
jgi:hypothetical protein